MWLEKSMTKLPLGEEGGAIGQDARGLNNLAILYARNGKQALAKALYKKCIGEQPDYVDPYFNLGMLQSDLGNFEDAITVLRKSIKLSPENMAGYYHLAVVLLRKGDIAEAIKEFKTAIQINPSAVEPVLHLARVFCETGDLAGAEEYARRLENMGQTASASKVWAEIRSKRR